MSLQLNRILLLFILFLFNSEIVYCQFGVATKFDSLASEGVLRIFDIDKDGDNDVLWSDGTAGSRIGVHENLGDGSWKNISLGYTSGSATDITTFDLNNDGLDEIFVAGWNGNQVKWYKNWGNNVYTPMDSSTSVVQPFDISFSDKNNDNLKDMVVQGRTSSKWFRNTGAGKFDTIVILYDNFSFTFKGQTGSTRKSMDFNGDGLDDLLYVDPILGPFIKINEGSGVYNSKSYIIDNAFKKSTESAYFYRVEIATGDIDLDGDIDFICHNSKTPLVYYENINNTLHFFRHEILGSDKVSLGNINFLMLDDVENDGDLDLIFSNDDTHAKYALNFTNSQYKYKGKTFYDANQNGVFDLNEKGLSFIDVMLDTDTLISSVNSNGDYTIPSKNGSHTIGFVPDSLWRLTSSSATYTETLGSISPIKNNLDFGFYPSKIEEIIETDIVGGLPRCNSIVNYWFDFSNKGTTTPSLVVSVELDSILRFVNSTIPPDSVIGNSIYWFIDSLSIHDQKRFNIEVQMPTWQNMGDTITSVLKARKIDTLGNLSTLTTDTLFQKLVCAYDPNEKTVTPLGVGSEGYISNNQELEYLIRFQNTGSDTARNITIIDSITSKLDFKHIKLVSSSHPCQLKTKNQHAYFNFKNIMLPDSSVNEVNSHGYVKFRIKPIHNLPAETIIKNFASIYFDANPGIITDTTLNTIFNCKDINVSMLKTNICKNENIAGYVNEKYTNSILWRLESTQIENNDTLIFSPKNSGNQILHLETSNKICKKDTTFAIQIYPKFTSVTTMSICHSDSVLVYGSYKSASGIYYDTLQTLNGCDSVLITNLTVLEKKFGFENISICPGDSIFLGGKYQNKQGIYSDTLVTLLGCDSVLYRNLNIKSIQEVIAAPVSICIGDSLIVFGQYQHNEGTYIDTLQSFNGCDSIVRIYLSVIEKALSSPQNIEICQGDSIQIGSLFYNSNGVYYDTIQTVLGCDSIVQYILHVNTLPDVMINEFSDSIICIESDTSDLVLPFAFPSGGFYSGEGVLNNLFSPSLCKIGKSQVYYSFINKKGCMNIDSTDITIVKCLGISELNDSGKISVSLAPNPFQESLNISIIGDLSFPYSIIVTDISGKNMLTLENINTSHVLIKKSELPNGLYFVYLVGKQGENYSIGKVVSE